MNKVSTIIIIAAIIFVLYYFREQLKKLIAPDVQIVINGTLPEAKKPGCSCEHPETTEEEQAQETGEYMPEDLMDILYPTPGNFSSGTNIYPGSYN